MKLTQIALCLAIATATANTPVTATTPITAPSPSMSPPDYPFLVGVTGKLEKGLYISDQQKMSDGHSVCQQLKNGETLGQLTAQKIQSLEGQSVSVQYPMMGYYKAVQEYAIRNYCPGFSQQLGWIYGGAMQVSRVL